MDFIHPPQNTGWRIRAAHARQARSRQGREKGGGDALQRARHAREDAHSMRPFLPVPHPHHPTNAARACHHLHGHLPSVGPPVQRAPASLPSPRLPSCPTHIQHLPPYASHFPLPFAHCTFCYRCNPHLAAILAALLSACATIAYRTFVPPILPTLLYAYLHTHTCPFPCATLAARGGADSAQSLLRTLPTQHLPRAYSFSLSGPSAYQFYSNMAHTHTLSSWKEAGAGRNLGAIPEPFIRRSVMDRERYETYCRT